MTEFIGRVQAAIIDPLITLLALAAFVVFVWGVVEFIRGAENSEKREKGVRHITWALIGLVIIFGARALVAIIASTTEVFK